MNEYIKAKEGDLKSAVDFFKKDISSLRTGRANPALLEGVFVEAYGIKNPISAIGTISVSDSKSMTVSPWDRNLLKDIEKGVVEADLGVGVVNEGDKIRISIPPMTEENRRELVRKLNEKMEKSRISLRQLREEMKESIEAAFDAKEITEDEKFKFIKELDEEIRKRNDELKEIRDGKEKEIMTI
jgi:ribosome recycling factor